MLSRVADSLYWMSRYIERAEHTARLIAVKLESMVEQTPDDANASWARVIEALTGEKTVLGPQDAFAITRRLAFDRDNDASLITSLSMARDNARQVREEISTEQWQRLNRLYHQIHSPHAETEFRTNVSDALAQVTDGIYLFKGITDTTMIHGQGWQFIRLGRYLERAYATATLLEVFQPMLFASPEREHSGNQYLELVGLLRCCTAFEAYCQVYTADISSDRVLEFLLLNNDFPHAIRYTVEGIRQALDSIQRTGGRRVADELTAGIGRLHAMLGYTTIGEILTSDTAAFLHSIREQCLRIHEMVYRFYVHYSIQSALAI